MIILERLLLKVNYELCYTSGTPGFSIIKHAYADPRKTVNQNRVGICSVLIGLF
jgi:hypothetical protein